MGFIDWVKSAFSKKQVQGTGIEISRWTTAPPRRGTLELLRAYREMPQLRRMVGKISDNVANVRWRAYRRVSNGQPVKDYSLRSAPAASRRESLKSLLKNGEAIEVLNHPALGLLANPNDYLTGRSVMKLAQAHYDLVGDIFLVLQRVGGMPVGFWPVPPSWVISLPNYREPIENQYYKISIATFVKDIPAVDMIHMRDPDPDDPLGRGVGAGFALGDELDTDEYAARFVKNCFWNNMTPATVISIEGAGSVNSNADAMKAFKEQLVREHQGPDRAGRTLFTNGKVSFARLDTSLKDMDFVKLRQFLQDFVREHYGIPPEIIGDISSSNKATAFAAREILAEQVIVPRLEFWRTELQFRLMPLFDDTTILEYDSPVPADREQELAVMTKMPEAFSYDEWREAAGLEPDPNRQGYPMPLPGQKPGDAAPADAPSPED